MAPAEISEDITLSTFVQVYTIRLEHIQDEMNKHRIEFQNYRKCANADRVKMAEVHRMEIDNMRQEFKKEMKEHAAETKGQAILMAKVQNQLNLITILVLAATTAIIGLVVKIFAAGGTIP